MADGWNLSPLSGRWPAFQGKTRVSSTVSSSPHPAGHGDPQQGPLLQHWAEDALSCWVLPWPKGEEVRALLRTALESWWAWGQQVVISEDGQWFVNHQEVLSVSFMAVTQLPGPLRGHGAGQAVGHQTRLLLAAAHVRLFPGAAARACLRKSSGSSLQVGDAPSPRGKGRRAPRGSAAAPALGRAGTWSGWPRVASGGWPGWRQG